MSNESSSSPEDLGKSLTEVFARYEVEPDVEISIRQGIAGPVIWLIKVVVDGTAFEAVKRLGKVGIKEIRALTNKRSRDSEARLMITDSEGTSLSLPKGIPDEALERLDWSTLRGGSIVWRANRKVWERRESLKIKRA